MAEADVTFMFDGQTYGFNPNKMSVLEGIECQKFTGFTYIEWTEALQKFDAEAFRFLVWITLKRHDKTPEGKYSAFDFDMAEVMASFEVPEDEPAVEREPDPTVAARKRSPSKSRSSSTGR